MANQLCTNGVASTTTPVPTLTLAKAYASLATVAANSGRTEGSVGNPNKHGRLFLSFGADRGQGALSGVHIIDPGDEIDFSSSPGRLNLAVFVRGEEDNALMTFEEAASAASVITLS